jgi:hypothetical protein
MEETIASTPEIQGETLKIEQPARVASLPPSPRVPRERSLSQSKEILKPASPQIREKPPPPVVQQPVVDNDNERKKKIVDFSPMVSLSVPLPFESDDEEEVEEESDKGEVPVLLISAVPEGKVHILK